MKITFLGTGTSTGIPTIGLDRESCFSEDPRDNRLRFSILIEYKNKNISLKDVENALKMFPSIDRTLFN